MHLAPSIHPSDPNHGADAMTVTPIDSGEAEQLDEDDRPYAYRPPSVVGPQWRVVPGPAGQGRCLAIDESELELRLLAPPGIPLQLPEYGSLRRWRSASWEGGSISTEVSELTHEAVRTLVPSHHAWIVEQESEERLRALAAQNLDFEALEDASMEVVVADRRPVSVFVGRRLVTAITQSASTYSALVLTQPSDAAVARVERVVNTSSSLAEISNGLREIADAIGVDQTRELVVALLHARARSHSWRCTWPLSVLEGRGPLERVVGREIDAARTGGELTQRLAAVELQASELDRLLVILLYARSRSVRWRITSPLRRLFGSRRLRGVRTLLRERVQPRFAALRGRHTALPPVPELRHLG